MCLLQIFRVYLFIFFFKFQHLDSGINVIQLETAAGAAMKDFNGAIGMNYLTLFVSEYSCIFLNLSRLTITGH